MASYQNFVRNGPGWSRRILSAIENLLRRLQCEHLTTMYSPSVGVSLFQTTYPVTVPCAPHLRQSWWFMEGIRHIFAYPQYPRLRATRIYQMRGPRVHRQCGGCRRPRSAHALIRRAS